MRSVSLVLVALSASSLVGCADRRTTEQPENAEPYGIWLRAPDLADADAGLQTLTIQPLDAGLFVEAVLRQPSSAEGTLHGKPVQSETLVVRVGLATELEPLTIAWGDSDRLDFFRSSDGVIRAAFWSGLSAQDRFYQFGALVLLEGGTSGPELLLPPQLGLELGLASPDEPLYELSTYAGYPTWAWAHVSSGRWRTANWPARLVRLSDGGLPVTEWPASRLEIDQDGVFRLFQLVEGQALAKQGVVTQTAAGRWSFAVQDVSVPLVLDDGTSVPTGAAGFAGGAQRGYLFPFASKDPELIITGLDSAPFLAETAPSTVLAGPGGSPVTPP